MTGYKTQTVQDIGVYFFCMMLSKVFALIWFLIFYASLITFADIDYCITTHVNGEESLHSRFKVLKMLFHLNSKVIIQYFEIRHQIKAKSLLNIMQKCKPQYLKGYWFYSQSYLTKQKIIIYMIMIWPWSDLWNILYIIWKTGWIRVMKLELYAQNIPKMNCNKFYEIWITSFKIMRS